MKMTKDIPILEQLAASQWGLFTTAQAQKEGIQRNQVARLVSKDKAEMLCYGVYRLVAGDETPAADVKAAWMSVFPKSFVADRMKTRPFDAVVAGRTAASLYGFGDFYASPYTFLVPERKQTSRHDMKYLLWKLDEQDVVFVSGLPTTSIERTVADLVRLHEDPDHIDGFINNAIQSGFDFDIDRLSFLLSPLAARNGYKKLDGRTFASELLSRNGLSIQLEHVGQQLQNVSKALNNSEAMREVIDSLSIFANELSKKIALSSVSTINSTFAKQSELIAAPFLESMKRMTDQLTNPVLLQTAEQISAITRFTDLGKTQAAQEQLDSVRSDARDD